jgi:prevent-host-death family protein
MRLREEIKPITALKTGAARLLRAVGKTRRPVVIAQSGEPKGVLVDFEKLRGVERGGAPAEADRPG